MQHSDFLDFLVLFHQGKRTQSKIVLAINSGMMLQIQHAENGFLHN